MLAAGPSDENYQLTGEVTPGYDPRNGNELRFDVADRDGGEPGAAGLLLAAWSPTRSREGREVIVSGTVDRTARSWPRRTA